MYLVFVCLFCYVSASKLSLTVDSSTGGYTVGVDGNNT